MVVLGSFYQITEIQPSIKAICDVTAIYNCLFTAFYMLTKGLVSVSRHIFNKKALRRVSAVNKSTTRATETVWKNSRLDSRLFCKGVGL